MNIQSLQRPGHLKEALKLLADNPGITPIAGGTDLIVQLRGHVRDDRHLLDLTACLPRHIEFENEELRIGAGAVMDSIARSQQVGRMFPALASAAGRVGAWPIQCRATIGGNLANASPAADTAPALLVSDTVLVLVCGSSRRELPLRDFFKGPGRTVLRPGELILELRIPRSRVPAVSHFEKLGWRRGQVISVVSLAVEYLVDDSGRIRDPRVAFGAVAATPKRAPRIEELLEGKIPQSVDFDELAAAVDHDIAPIDDLRAPAWYRRLAAPVMLLRVLQGGGHV